MGEVVEIKVLSCVDLGHSHILRKATRIRSRWVSASARNRAALAPVGRLI